MTTTPKNEWATSAVIRRGTRFRDTELGYEGRTLEDCVPSGSVIVAYEPRVLGSACVPVSRLEFVEVAR